MSAARKKKPSSNKARTPSEATPGTTCLTAELAWLEGLIDGRLKIYFQIEGALADLRELAPPPIPRRPACAYGRFLAERQPGFAERALLALAIAPHVSPELLDGFYARNQTYNRRFTEFGGCEGQNHPGFLPTAETAFFLLAGGDQDRRAELYELFASPHWLHGERLLRVEPAALGEPRWSGRLALSDEAIEYWTTGNRKGWDPGPQFPATRITSGLEWDDLVLRTETREGIEEILDWLHCGERLLRDWGMACRLKPGHKALFHGEPGTGKTLTATLLGARTDREVYRIDLATLVSKYIGETEKNLSQVFDAAQGRDWVLFFDEADALFGKRTEVRSSNDRYANQEVAYLLQRIEDFPGLVILATNRKDNIDVAFNRRFHSVIHFPEPNAEERLAIWRGAISPRATLAADVDLEEIAQNHRLTGGLIVNAARSTMLKVLRRGRGKIRRQDLETGIRRELQKEGRLLP